jgi:hypothetical protein
MAFGSLLQREYWQRMWVIQETYVANVFTVHCGADIVRWTGLLAIQKTLIDHEPAMITFSREHNLGMKLLDRLWTRGPQAMTPAEPGTELTTREPTTYEALIFHSSKLCSYPIDRVYSIVGFTSARFGQRFVIHYTRGIRQVFIDVPQYTIIASQKLDIIYVLQPLSGTRNLETPHLPSWVPDWAAPSPYEDSLLSGSKERYNASRSSAAHVTFLLDRESLLAKGFIIGTVSALGVTTGI